MPKATGWTKWNAENPELRRADNRKRWATRTERYRQIVKDYLLSHPCVDCGESDIVVLEFDHVRGTKTASIGQLIAKGRSETIIVEEIAKCDVRCANCHRRRHCKLLNSYRVQ